MKPCIKRIIDTMLQFDSLEAFFEAQGTLHEEVAA